MSKLPEEYIKLIREWREAKKKLEEYTEQHFAPQRRDSRDQDYIIKEGSLEELKQLESAVKEIEQKLFEAEQTYERKLPEEYAEPINKSDSEATQT